MKVSSDNFKSYAVQRQESKLNGLVLDIMTLNVLCKYVLCVTRMMRLTHLVNLRKLILAIDPSTYENDVEKEKRFRFIIKALEARIDKRLTDREMILVDINGGIQYELDFIDYNNLDITQSEFEWCTTMISETLQYQFMYQKIDRVQDMCARFTTTDFKNRGTIVREFESLLDELKNDYRKSRVEDNLTNMTFSLREGVFEDAVTDVYNVITNPSRRLICGMSGLNEMLGGGFESGRVYMLMGSTGIGKSITLLNLMYQIKKYNVNYKTKDPSKQPCIVMLTMENTVVETITRLFDLVTTSNDGRRMADYSLDEVLTKLRVEGGLVLNNISPIDIVIKYKPNKSVDTSYLYTLYDDLEDQGYEMICLVQDHVKRIRSIYRNSDVRLELGDIVNEFKVFAAEKDIPVISNTHLNRDAAKIIEESANRMTNMDVTMKLGKSNIGESMLMLDNLDCGIIINIDFDEDTNRFLCFNLVKMRDKTDRKYIAHPFVAGSTIKLVEDIGGVPMFRESLHYNPNIQRNPSIRMTSANVMSNFSILDDDDNDKITDNAFSKMSSYTIPVDDSIPDMISTDPKDPIKFIEPRYDILNGIKAEIEASKIDNQTPSEGFCPIKFSQEVFDKYANGYREEGFGEAI